MATIAAGSSATVYLPVAQTITITPGTSGKVSLNGRGIDGSAVTPREIYTATAVAFRAGDTVTLDAVNVDATYTDVADAGMTAAQAAALTSSVVDASGNVLASGGALGPYADLAALVAAKPAASNSGKTAMVGAAAPYAIYSSDGAVWSVDGGAALSILSPQIRAANKYIAAKARGAANPPRVLFLGDSTVAGAGTGTGTDGEINARGNSWPTRLATDLGWQKMSICADNNFGASTPVFTLPTVDPRVTLGSWAAAGTANTLGGRPIQVAGASVSDFVFTPGEAWDTWTIWYPQAVGLGAGTTNIKVNGSTVDSFTSNAATSLSSKTGTVTRGVNTFALDHTGAGTAQFSVIELRDSTLNKARTFNGAACGLTVTFHADQSLPYSPLSVSNTLAPDLVLISSTVNEAVGSVAVDTFASNIDIICNKFASYADIVVMIGPPANSTNVIGTLYDSYKNVLRRLYDTFPTLSVLDLRDPLGASYAEALRRSLWITTGSSTAVHPNTAGSIAQFNYVKTKLVAMGVS